MKRGNRSARWIKHELCAWLGQRDATYVLSNLLWSKESERVFYRTVSYRDLVMEGFGGSANSFAWWAFRSANPDVRIGHHLHVPAHVIRALQCRVPVILLVRDPVGAVVSLYSRGYIPALKQGFRHYTMFHRRLLPYRNRFMVATFHDVTTDMGEVIARCNDMYGTNFIPFEHTAENAQQCRLQIRASSQVTEERNERKMAAEERIVSEPGLQSLRQRAEDLFHRYVGG